MNAKEYLAKLRRDIERHPGVNHPLLGRVAQVPFTKEDYKIMCLQHYPLVGMFTTYLELLLLTAPDSDAKSWIAKVLVDEYGEGVASGAVVNAGEYQDAFGFTVVAQQRAAALPERVRRDVL